MIKPINRILNLIGVDCELWYNNMPKTIRASAQHRSVAGGGIKPLKAVTLDKHFNSVHCLVCGVKTNKLGELSVHLRWQAFESALIGLNAIDICKVCRSRPSISIHTLLSRYHLAESRLVSAHRICASCSSTPLAEEVKCDSLDCPVLYARVKAGWNADDVSGIPALVERLEQDMVGSDPRAVIEL